MIERRELFNGWPGCTDGHCIVHGTVKGMHTNGGCRCIVNASRAQLSILQCRLNSILTKHERAASEGKEEGDVPV